MSDNGNTMIQPRLIQPATEDEVVDMLVQQAQFDGTPEMRAVAVKLLESGYTLRVVASKLGIAASVIWKWADDAEIRKALRTGNEYRRQVINQRLEAAADDAVTALGRVVADDNVAPRDRIKAAEAILDRCGLVDVASSPDNATMIAVDIDFDDRLARIVAGSAPKTRQPD